MVTFFRLPIFLLLGFCSVSHSSLAQTDNLRVAVANMGEDVGLLIQQVKAMRLELEAMQRENSKLQAQVRSLQAEVESDSQISMLSGAIENVRREFRQADAAQKKELVAELSKQIGVLAKEMESALQKVNRTSPAVSNPGVSVTFPDNYPKTGKPYVVRSGDSLSRIAQEHGSTVKFIQNANKIVDPSRDLRVGDTIFIPIAE